MKRFNENFINGQWTPSASTEYLTVADPNTGEERSQVVVGDKQDALAAIAAANQAFKEWSQTSLQTRIDAVKRFAGELGGMSDALMETIASEVGTPLKISRIVQTAAPIQNCSNFIEIAEQFEWSRKVKNSIVYKEPIGVVACITPWNFPLHQIVLKIVPALLCGNTIVLKPSELTPQTTHLVATALERAKLPPGVVNVINGQGPNVGMPLAESPDVHMVSFTGSTATGKAIMQAAAATVKKVALELGGKSASVILPTADLQRAVKSSLASCMLNNGQTCSALTRMLVPADRLEEVEEMLRAEFGKLSVGNSLDTAHRVGPLISASQQKRAQGLVDAGIEQGATTIAVNDAIPGDGFFTKPIALKVTGDNVLAREEVFGPVLSVLTYETIDEAVEIANATEYGLAAAVWGEHEQALNTARRIRAGQVDVNGAPFNAFAPFGGFGQSGIGREGGEAGLEEFVEYKAVQIPAEMAVQS